jgi:hypothetical protein
MLDKNVASAMLTLEYTLFSLLPRKQFCWGRTLKMSKAETVIFAMDNIVRRPSV